MTTKVKTPLFQDLGTFNSLIAHYYTKNSHLMNFLSGTTQHSAWKIFSIKFDCSRSYHSSKIAQQRSLKKPIFSFATTTFVYGRLSLWLRVSVSDFSSFIQGHFNPVAMAARCAWDFDATALAAFLCGLYSKLWKALKCILRARL